MVYYHLIMTKIIAKAGCWAHTDPHLRPSVQCVHITTDNIIIITDFLLYYCLLITYKHDKTLDPLVTTSFLT